MSETSESDDTASIPAKPEKKKTCGIIMPIAANLDYSADHWKDVLKILVDAIQINGDFEAKLVSDDVAIGLIHERIVSNIYGNEMVVCDVSSKNPNVMFELGMRLAFDKPTIIIKDDSTGYSFDTGVVEHLGYPRSLRFGDIIAFKEKLHEKIQATFAASQTAEGHSPFLKSFGKTIKPAKINETQISEGAFIVSELNKLSSQIRVLRKEIVGNPADFSIKEPWRKYELKAYVQKAFLKAIRDNPGLSTSELINIINSEMYIDGYPQSSMKMISDLVKELISNGPNPGDDV